jgi:hypothetical protein
MLETMEVDITMALESVASLARLDTLAADLLGVP